MDKKPAATLRSPPGIEGIHWPLILTGGIPAHVPMQVQFEISQWWDPERILAYQLAQLRNVMAHAKKTTPFYRHRLKAALALSTGRDMNLSDFQQIPILTRNEFQDAGDSIQSTAVPASHGGTHSIRTSGSTGQPLSLKGTHVTAMFHKAMTLRLNLWHRKDFSQKSLAFRTMKPGESTIRNPPTSGPVVNYGGSVKVSMAQPASTLLEIMKEENPAYLTIHPSVLKELLYISRHQGYQPANLRAVSTLGEILYPELRERCERQWNVRVIDNYSCMEFGVLALQCPDYPHYHVQSECSLINATLRKWRYGGSGGALRLWPRSACAKAHHRTRAQHGSST
jgi:phenylacetate-CoA ligase